MGGTKPTFLLLCENVFKNLSEAKMRLQSSILVKSSGHFSKLYFISAEFPLFVKILPLELNRETQRGKFLLKRLTLGDIYLI